MISNIKVVGTGSSGNSYIIQTHNGEKLLLEAGVSFKETQKALDYDLTNISGAFVSHRHGDHSKSIPNFIKYGIKVYSNSDVKDKYDRVISIEPDTAIKAGTFKVLPFAVEHDVPCYGYLINHGCDNILFATDTAEIPIEFKIPINVFMIEANYSSQYYIQKMFENQGGNANTDHILDGHMNAEYANEYIMKHCETYEYPSKAIMIHLSDSNSNIEIYDNIFEELKKTTEVIYANNGDNIEIAERIPF